MSFNLLTKYKVLTATIATQIILGVFIVLSLVLQVDISLLPLMDYLSWIFFPYFVGAAGLILAGLYYDKFSDFSSAIAWGAVGIEVFLFLFFVQTLVIFIIYYLIYLLYKRFQRLVS